MGPRGAHRGRPPPREQPLDAQGDPCAPAPRFDDASRALAGVGLDETARRHAHTGEPLADAPDEVADWKVCRRQPSPDTVVSSWTRPGLWLIGPGRPCTETSPKPKPKPRPEPEAKPKPWPAPEPRPRPSRDGAPGGSTGGSGGSAAFGQFCSPAGATATTADGRPAKCFMGRDGRARWGHHSG
ncbi:hypothetical protein [Streptomyces sp. NRRL S-1521]|uniref:hypothetical protein n=1 Tax=Streptomyces sp. NRRL S-1521 TaxID=1609100 RepID=UPI0007467FB7|nr:hypothetical protein [Streptomyces sp. NRRL S-1521]KUL52208.1 hypothetical protein ADL30_24265 [Streptomyces sp. NRRL S-1521]